MLAWVVYREHYSRRTGHRLLMHSGLVLAAVICLVAHIHLHIPVISLKADRDPLKQFHSWRRMGSEIAAVIESRPDAGGWFLLADKGTTLAEAVFYTGNRYIGFDPFVPQRYRFLTGDDLEPLRGCHAVILAHNRSEAGLRRFDRMFRRVVPVGIYTHQYRGEPIPGLSTAMLVGEDFLGNWP
jgi:hypothetical protein